MEELQLYHLVRDRLGTVEAVIDESGDEVATFRYDAFGNQISRTGISLPEVEIFAGHVRDEETGLFYMRARYYDPRVGRFISPDPAGPLARKERTI